jgi:hypothetical protein
MSTRSHSAHGSRQIAHVHLARGAGFHFEEGTHRFCHEHPLVFPERGAASSEERHDQSYMEG